ncbi:hypothetical protein ARMGADRAFT_544492 [Armillaria gallica]|uniref:Uncharacterized protein n=1 Tax=Armillaria gallica TaxID=47427 RepID=A0A2H3D4U0_ARMGA|nr:hypothetical protein ARMGADRAFT_544492 [Armillaria gallica]
MDHLGYHDLPGNSHPLCHLIHRRSVHVRVHQKSSPYSDLSSSQLFGNQPVDPQLVTVYDCRCCRTSWPAAKDWTLRSRLRTITLSPDRRMSLTFSNSHFLYGYALSRTIPSGSELVRIHKDDSLRAGNGSYRVLSSCFSSGNSNKQQDETSQLTITGSLRRRKVNASTSWHLGAVKWERSFLRIKLPRYVLYSIPCPADFKASSTTRS